MKPGLIERAYQLAPECRSLDELRIKLVKENYESIDAHLQGGVIKADLKRLLHRDPVAG